MRKAAKDSEAQAALRRYAQSGKTIAGLDEVQKERVWKRTKLAAEASLVRPVRRRRRSVAWSSGAAVAAGLALVIGFVGYAMGEHQAFGPGANRGMLDLNGPLPKLLGLPTASPTGFRYPISLRKQLPAGASVVSPDGNWFLQYDASQETLQMTNMQGQSVHVGDAPMGIIGGTQSDGVLLATFADSNMQVADGFLPALGETVTLPGGNNPDLTLLGAAQSMTGRWAILEKHEQDWTPPGQWLSIDGHEMPGMEDTVDLAWNPNGNELAVIKEGYDNHPFELAFYDALTKKTTIVDDALMVQGIEPASHNLFWSPDGKLLAVSADGLLKVYPLGNDGGKVQTSQSVAQLGWLNDKTLLLSARKTGQLVVEQWLNQTLVKARGPRLKGDVLHIEPIGNDMALVQTTAGVYVVTATRAVQLVQQSVDQAWYDEVNHHIYFVPAGMTEIDTVDVTVHGAGGGTS